MPAVGARRSTRGFLPKSREGVDSAALVLRSGKRLVLSKPSGKKVEADGRMGGDWIQYFRGSAVDGVEEKEEGTKWPKGVVLGRNGGRKQTMEVEKPLSSVEVEKPLSSVEVESPVQVSELHECRRVAQGKMFGIVYSRKRRRTTSDGGIGSSSELQCGDKDDENRRFGISFVRRKDGKRANLLPPSEKGKSFPIDLPNVPILVSRNNVSLRTGIQLDKPVISEPSRAFAVKVGVQESHFWDGSGDSGVLLVLIDTSDCNNLLHFSFFLVSTLAGMRRKDVNLLDFASFLLNSTISYVFSEHGIHFLPVKWDNYFVNSIPVAGVCRISCADTLVPGLSLNFASLPFYFKSLHLSMILNLKHVVPYSGYTTGPQKSKHVGSCSMEITVPECQPLTEKFRCSGPYGTESSSRITNEKRKIVSPRSMSYLPGIIIGVEAPRLTVQNGVAHELKVRRCQNKRTKMRSARVRSSSMNDRRNLISSIHKRILRVNSSAVKENSVRVNLETPTSMEHIDTFSGNCPGQDGAVMLSPTSPIDGFKRSSHMSSLDLTKDVKSTLSGIKQNIGIACCKANILVIESDKCWREQGAEIMLEASDSNEWCLAVKVKGSIRYLFKAQDMRPSTTNRFTHAAIWSGENGWKLEFDDKMEWTVFKELHRDCFYRNSQEATVRMIPVPGVHIVPGYQESHSTFVRPDYYISTKYDEVERALMSDNAYYDMDSADEEWLRQLNSTSVAAENGQSRDVSYDNFEKIIFTFEKAAFCNPDVVCDQEKAANCCLDLGGKDVVVAIFDYWLKKKRQKRTALIRVFQDPSRKVTVIPRPILRKKRSLKRQGSNAGRGKPEYYLQAGAMKEELRRVQEAEGAASRSVEAAIKSRRRVQILMENADLAAYKAAMTLRLAEAMQESGSTDLFSSFVG